MARGNGARIGANPTEITLRLLGEGLEALSRRVRKLEAVVSNQTFPADIRVDTVEEDGQMWIVVERVSTGNTERIAGPL